MRYREVFGLYKRILKSGKKIFYYTTYDESGKKLCGHSTGKSTKSEARNYCAELIRSGALNQKRESRITFSDFAKGWWEWDTCSYLKKQRARRTLSKSYADSSRRILKAELIPQFGKMRLSEITDTIIENWIISYQDKGIKNRTVNLFLSIFCTMMNEAVRTKILKYNPAMLVKKLKEEEFNIEILTLEEMRQLFPCDWKSIWDYYEIYVANKLAACTGMRIGEVLGLRGEFVFATHITVFAQFTSYGYVDTKTHKQRNIPIPKLLINDLLELKKKNGEAFLFSFNGGVKPISREFVLDKGLYVALGRIGIDKAAREKRHLSFHAWRHFFNTTLRMANVADSKVQEMIGHQTLRMTRHYTHFDPTEFQEVRMIQEGLLAESPDKLRSEDSRNASVSKKAVSSVRH